MELDWFPLNMKKKSYKRKKWRPPSKKKQKTWKDVSPRNRRACHNVGTALLKKRRGDRNPECHEEQQKDVARIHVAHPPKNAEKETKVDRRTNCCIRT
jgi:hypothetical protein